MANYIIYINGNILGNVSGCEAAWDAYRKAVALCELTNAGCDLVDAETGEVIESFGYDAEEPEDTDEPYDLEYGFDPYEGCYTFDC